MIQALLVLCVRSGGGLWREGAVQEAVQEAGRGR